jgi:methylenetetrahydrofolate reductase (NADPH)
MPVVNFSQVRRIAKLCKAKLPAEFINAMEKAGESESAQFEAGVQFATQQVHELVRAGVPGLHFYVLNRSPATAQVLQQVGISGKN